MLQSFAPYNAQDHCERVKKLNLFVGPSPENTRIRHKTCRVSHTRARARTCVYAKSASYRSPFPPARPPASSIHEVWFVKINDK